jgi:hypothetical protein
MSVEDRLRDGLARNAGQFRPDVERRLTRVMTRRRRRQRVRWAGALAATMLVLVIVASGASMLRQHGSPRPELGGSATSGGSGQALTGTYTATVPESAATTNPTLAGEWVLTLRADGTMTVRAPAAYRGVLSGALFDSAAGRFRTSLLTEDLCTGLGNGTYRWTRTGSTVTFTVADDRCDARASVLTTTRWQRNS